MPAEPFIPEHITVHLGAPDDKTAKNVTVSFPEYVKIVASGELSPNWPLNAIRANIYAIVSYALNRIYTDFYRSKGYNFDITGSAQHDHAFNPNQTIYEPVSMLADELFNDYAVRQGSITPLFTTYCDGINVKCKGLSQWETVSLAQDGFVPYEILTYYFGDNINLVKNAPVKPNILIFPGTPLTTGAEGNDVKTIQIMLNRISSVYTDIPKIYPVDAAFSNETESAVRAFQKIFALPPKGIVDKATWYKINYIYNDIRKFALLNLKAISHSPASIQFLKEIKFGDSGEQVRFLQQMLSIIAAYYDDVSAPEITGDYNQDTADSVMSFQNVYGLPQTGVVDSRTWNDIYRAYAGIVNNPKTTPYKGISIVLYPGTVLSEGTTNEYVRKIQEYLTFIHRTYSNIPTATTTGYFGPITRSSVSAFQKQFGLPQTGSVGSDTWYAIAEKYADLKYGVFKQPGQYPGYVIK